MTDPGDTTPNHGDATDLGHLVAHLSRRLRHHRMRSLEPFGLAAHQARAFMMIARAGDGDSEIRPSDLARRLGIAARSATEVVDALEAMDLVERRPSPTDRRATRLLLTDAGEALRAELAETRADRSDEFFEVLDPDERATLRGLLTKVLDATD